MNKTLNEICEHCRGNILVWSLYGKYRTYICIKEKRRNPILAGFSEPCTGNPACYCWDDKEGRTFFPYKKIAIEQMRKTVDCIEQERKEKETKKEEIKRLRREAEGMLVKARELEVE